MPAADEATASALVPPLAPRSDAPLLHAGPSALASSASSSRKDVDVTQQTLARDASPAVGMPQSSFAGRQPFHGSAELMELEKSRNNISVSGEDADARPEADADGREGAASTPKSTADLRTEVDMPDTDANLETKRENDSGAGDHASPKDGGRSCSRTSPDGDDATVRGPVDEAPRTEFAPERERLQEHGGLNYSQPQAQAQPQPQVRHFRPPGLGNLGNTCYLNSVLQVLYHTPALHEAVLAYGGGGSVLPPRLAHFTDDLVCELKRVFQAMDDAEARMRCSVPSDYPRDGIEVVYPRALVDMLRTDERCPEFDARGQQDAQEFHIFMLDKLNDALSARDENPEAHVLSPRERATLAQSASNAIQRSMFFIPSSFQGTEPSLSLPSVAPLSSQRAFEKTDPTEKLCADTLAEKVEATEPPSSPAPPPVRTGTAEASKEPFDGTADGSGKELVAPRDAPKEGPSETMNTAAMEAPARPPSTASSSTEPLPSDSASPPAVDHLQKTEHSETGKTAKRPRPVSEDGEILLDSERDGSACRRSGGESSTRGEPSSTWKKQAEGDQSPPRVSSQRSTAEPPTDSVTNRTTAVESVAKKARLCKPTDDGHDGDFETGKGNVKAAEIDGSSKKSRDSEEYVNSASPWENSTALSKEEQKFISKQEKPGQPYDPRQYQQAHPAAFFQSHVVTDLFRGRAETVTQCIQCENKRSRAEHFLDVSLPVEIGKSLSWSFRENCKKHVMDGANKYACEVCQSHQEAQQYWRLSSVPPLLTVHLKLFAYSPNRPVGTKIPAAMPCPFSLQLSRWCTDVCEEANVRYYLSSVIVHEGGTASSGHYYAYVNVPKVGWFLFDDADVHVSSEEEIRRELFTSLQERCTPYILIYSVVEPTPS